MPFYYNDQEFSDKEMGQALNEKKQQRRDWCEQKAREYLATKERHKYYYCTYFVPEVEMHKYIKLPQEILDQIQAAIEKDKEENGTYDAIYTSDLSDIIQELGIEVQDYVDEYNIATLLDVNFDDYLYCYHFRVKRFDSEGNETADIWQIASLTDEQYIQAITELLYAPKQLSFDGLRRALPEIGTKIMNDCTSTDETSAIFMIELNDDVNAILNQVGGRDKIPGAGLFNNPFIGLIEYAGNRS